ncbi:MAG: hypothetical protein AABX72_05105 [Nanoarchaeota archaeon]
MICEVQPAEERCMKCGRMVCSIHYLPSRDLCSACGTGLVV